MSAEDRKKLLETARREHEQRTSMSAELDLLQELTRAREDEAGQLRAELAGEQLQDAVDDMARGQSTQDLTRLLQEQRMFAEQAETHATQRLAATLSGLGREPDAAAAAAAVLSSSRLPSPPVDPATEARADVLSQLSEIPDQSELVSEVPPEATREAKLDKPGSPPAGGPPGWGPRGPGAPLGDTVVPDSEDVSRSQLFSRDLDGSSRRRRDFEQSEVSLMQSIRSLRSRVAESQQMSDRSFALHDKEAEAGGGGGAVGQHDGGDEPRPPSS